MCAGCDLLRVLRTADAHRLYAGTVNVLVELINSPEIPAMISVF